MLVADRCLGGRCGQTHVSKGGQRKRCPSDFLGLQEQTRPKPALTLDTKLILRLSGFYFCAFSS